MKSVSYPGLLLLALAATGANALSLAPEEFAASREIACVLAQETLGQISEEEYGRRTHDVLDRFDDAERDNILAKALGYYDGLMFAIPDDNKIEVNHRLEDFVASRTCVSDFQQVTYEL